MLSRVNFDQVNAIYKSGVDLFDVHLRIICNATSKLYNSACVLYDSSAIYIYNKDELKNTKIKIKT